MQVEQVACHRQNVCISHGNNAFSKSLIRRKARLRVVSRFVPAELIAQWVASGSYDMETVHAAPHFQEESQR